MLNSMILASMIACQEILHRVEHCRKLLELLTELTEIRDGVTDRFLRAAKYMIEGI